MAHFCHIRSRDLEITRKSGQTNLQEEKLTELIWYLIVVEKGRKTLRPYLKNQRYEVHSIAFYCWGFREITCRWLPVSSYKWSPQFRHTFKNLTNIVIYETSKRARKVNGRARKSSGQRWATAGEMKARSNFSQPFEEVGWGHWMST